MKCEVGAGSEKPFDPQDCKELWTAATGNYKQTSVNTSRHRVSLIRTSKVIKIRGRVQKNYYCTRHLS
jgi:hypothetical protein